MMITNMKKKPIELYIHIPFCVKKCDYCDFLSFRALSSVHEAYVQQLIREIRAQSCYCTDCQVVSVFIGGGTPSLLEPSCISRIMETVFSCFQVEPEAEITIEANPGTLLGKKLPVYRQCGINRVSIGLQSADNTELKNLGRIHSFEEFLKSFQSARMAGFTNINIDLMSGIPGQTLESWKNTLKKVTMLKPEHISAYSLIIEEGTPFWNRFGEGACACDYTGPALPDEDTENKIYRFTESSCRSRALSGTRSQIMQNREKNAAIISVTGLRWHIWDWDLGHPPIWKAVVLPMKRTWISIWHWILVKKIRKSGRQPFANYGVK